MAVDYGTDYSARELTPAELDAADLPQTGTITAADWAVLLA